MPDLATAYADTRRSMIDLARDADLTARVPACPDWNVKQLIAHVTSVAGSLAGGQIPPDFDPVGSMIDEERAVIREAHIAKTLAQREHLPIEEIVKEWEESGLVVDAMIRGERPFPDGSPPFPEWIVMTDAAIHHHDLRGAIGVPGDRDSLATGLALRSYVEAMRFRSAAEGRPAFTLIAGPRSWVIGNGDPVATLTADPFELSRTVSGRRSPEQIRAYDWDGDPGPVLDLFYPYGPRADELVE
ncbi:MAG TPA: maleylpyruvate isomerase family mycothiol-dependent enzyme [Actinomycetota bacterium]